MKKFISFTFFCLILSSLSFSQSLIGQWQLQDYSKPFYIEIVGFDGKNFCLMVSDVNTGMFLSYQGVYTVNGNTVTITTDTGDIVVLKFGFNQGRLVLSSQNSNALYNRISYGVGPSPNPSQNSDSQTCIVCYGSGRCKICNGRGSYSYYGQASTPCSDCNRTGRCSYCNGTGVRKR